MLSFGGQMLEVQCQSGKGKVLLCQRRIHSICQQMLLKATSAINLRAVQLLLGHTKMDSTVRYLGVELDDALSISEATEI